MLLTILKLLSPLLQRLLAKRLADYLNARRERRLAPLAEAAPLRPDEPAPLSPGLALRFTLIGVLIGSSLGFVLAYLWQRAK
jgi:hypothetical protein